MVGHDIEEELEDFERIIMAETEKKKKKVGKIVISSK